MIFELRIAQESQLLRLAQIGDVLYFQRRCGWRLIASDVITAEVLPTTQFQDSDTLICRTEVADGRLSINEYDVTRIKRGNAFIAIPELDDDPWPQPKDVYWYIDSRSEIRRSSMYDWADRDRLRIGNCYRTQDEADVARDRVVDAYRGESS